MRTSRFFSIDSPNDFKNNLLQWAQQFEEITWLDSNRTHQKYGEFDALLAVDAFTILQTDVNQGFKKLKEYQESTKDWIFGTLSYDLKNDTENLTSSNNDFLDCRDIFFFQPKKIFILRGSQLEIQYLGIVDTEIQSDFVEILYYKEERIKKEPPIPIKIRLRMTKDTYKNKVKMLLRHIHRGDIYEANFCQEFYSENSEIDPLSTYQHLNRISEPPFASFIKLHHQYILCASPERYLKRKGNQIISQPIKGTAKRGGTPESDQDLKENLKIDPKERSENIMIVDLVRNDLSKTAKKGTVKVAELCKIYSYKQVHQMISTVLSEIENKTSSVEVLKSTFPMGSMTGAPKIKAMQLIESLEKTKRGIYSGAIGYFTPTGNFDFNVVIRSILYNSKKKYVSYIVGSAITAKSNPDREYEECLIKAKAMREALERTKKVLK